MLVLKYILNRLSGGSREVRRTQGALNTEMAFGQSENLFGNNVQNKNCGQSEFKVEIKLWESIVPFGTGSFKAVFENL